MEQEWKTLSASVAGTSHLSSGLPCQDSATVEVVAGKDGRTLLFACADGAGSALRSEIGSRWACDTLIGEFSDYVVSHDIASISRQVAEIWLIHVMGALTSQASELGIPLRELACTLIGGVVGPKSAVFLQVGDGAIVADLEGYKPIFWPQSGEYANTTYFVSQTEVLTHLQFVAIDRRISQVAAFSDGLQLLALNFASKEAHTPFFKALFDRIESTDAEEITSLRPQLIAYLDSDIVNARTDDDKTLVLASRSA